MSIPLAPTPIVPAPRPLPGYSRVTGEPIVLMPSASEPGVMHIVTMGGTCSCKGFTYRNRCRHLAPVPEPQAVRAPLVARMMA